MENVIRIRSAMQYSEAILIFFLSHFFKVTIKTQCQKRFCHLLDTFHIFRKEHSYHSQILIDYQLAAEAMTRGNNVIPNAHFHKHWQKRIKCWFDQPARKVRRRQARIAKAAKVAPRPTAGLLRPAVRCPSIRYNTKLRMGRGFTLEELKGAGLTKYEAKSFGIAVDFRRVNRSVESLEVFNLIYFWWRISYAILLSLWCQCCTFQVSQEGIFGCPMENHVIPSHSFEHFFFILF